MKRLPRLVRPLRWIALSRKDLEDFPTKRERILKTKPVDVYQSGGNIFTDLGLPDAESHFLKAQLVAELYRLTNARKLTQSKAGELMGISQPEVSRLFKGSFREYSVERLMAFLTAFDCDVEIVSRPRVDHKGRGHITFSAAMA